MFSGIIKKTLNSNYVIMWSQRACIFSNCLCLRLTYVYDKAATNDHHSSSSSSLSWLSKSYELNDIEFFVLSS